MLHMHRICRLSLCLRRCSILCASSYARRKRSLSTLSTVLRQITQGAGTAPHLSLGTVRFWAGLSPRSRHLRECITKWRTPDCWDTVWTNVHSSS